MIRSGLATIKAFGPDLDTSRRASWTDRWLALGGQQIVVFDRCYVIEATYEAFAFLAGRLNLVPEWMSADSALGEQWIQEYAACRARRR